MGVHTYMELKYSGDGNIAIVEKEKCLEGEFAVLVHMGDGLKHMRKLASEGQERYDEPLQWTLGE